MVREKQWIDGWLAKRTYWKEVFGCHHRRIIGRVGIKRQGEVLVWSGQHVGHFDKIPQREKMIFAALVSMRVRYSRLY